MIPQDPAMLLSFINMKLRNEHVSFAELCDDMNIEKEEIKAKLSEAGYEYSEELNKFW